MITQRRISLFSLLLASVFLSIGAAQAAPDAASNTLSPAETAAGWKLLFDGRTTTGWRGYARTNFSGGAWSAEDGCLTTKGGGCDLVTVDKFDDFDFKFEWRISPSGNSGVKYFVHEGKTGKSGIGCEYQILDDAQNKDAVNGANRQAGALYALIAPNNAKHLNPVGDWNQSEIIVRGKHVEHWLNGARIVEFEAGSPELAQAIAKSKFRNVPNFGQKMTTLLLLQDHGDPVWFRNLKIRPRQK